MSVIFICDRCRVGLEIKMNMDQSRKSKLNEIGWEEIEFSDICKRCLDKERGTVLEMK